MTKGRSPFPQVDLQRDGRLAPTWREFFLTLFQRTGGEQGGDLGSLTAMVAELSLQLQAQVSPPVIPRQPQSDLIVPVIVRRQVDELTQLVPTHNLQDDPSLHAVATQSSAGFLSAADKAKLDGLAANALSPQSLTSDVTASNTTADVTVLTETLAANTARKGMLRRFTMYALVSNGTNAGTLQLWVKIGSTKVFTHAFTTPTTAATNKGLYVAFEWCFRAIGSGGQAQVSGTLFTNDTPAVTLTPDSLVTPAAIDTTVTQTFTFGFNWVAADAANAITAKSASLVGVV